MARVVNPRRPYNSAKRRAQAQATREEILAAAQRLFLTRGYGRTTIEAIATEAGVAPETVYAGFKNKRALLRQLLEMAAVGDEQPIPMRDRGWVHSLQAEPDPFARVRLLAYEGSKILERSADLFLVLRDAANSDDGLAADWAEVNQLMLRDHAVFARALAGENALRPGLTVQTATDVIWTIGSPEVYQRLVRWRAWTRQQYENWSAQVLQSTLFG